MTQFLESTLLDLRGGRQSWRVLITLSLPSFGIAVAAALVRVV
jgi:hypothetical protein